MSKMKIAVAAMLLSLTAGGALLLPTAPARSAEVQSGPQAKVGKAAPDFTLSDTQGKQESLSQYKGKFVVLEWINFDCPFVKKHYESGNMQGLQDKYTKQGVVWLAINTSAKGAHGNYPPAAVNDKLKELKAHPTAYLQDDQSTVARLYGATATPHMFVIDKAGTLIYAGAIDDKNTADKEDIKTAKNYVAATLDEALAGKKVATSSTKAYGCHIHYN